MVRAFRDCAEVALREAGGVEHRRGVAVRCERREKQVLLIGRKIEVVGLRCRYHLRGVMVSMLRPWMVIYVQAFRRCSSCERLSNGKVCVWAPPPMHDAFRMLCHLRQPSVSGAVWRWRGLSRRINASKSFSAVCWRSARTFRIVFREFLRARNCLR